MPATIMPERPPQGAGFVKLSPNYVKLSFQDLERVRAIMEEIDGSDEPLTVDEKRTLGRVCLIMGKMKEKWERGV